MRPVRPIFSPWTPIWALFMHFPFWDDCSCAQWWCAPTSAWKLWSENGMNLFLARTQLLFGAVKIMVENVMRPQGSSLVSHRSFQLWQPLQPWTRRQVPWSAGAWTILVENAMRPQGSSLVSCRASQGHCPRGRSQCCVQLGVLRWLRNGVLWHQCCFGLWDDCSCAQSRPHGAPVQQFVAICINL